MRRVCAVIGLGIGLAPVLAGGSVAAGAGPKWSVTRTLVRPRVQTFSPQLAVNHSGRAVAAWFSGPAPQVSAGGSGGSPGPGGGIRAWTGNQIVVAFGSITHGLGRPVVIAGNGTDVQNQVMVGLSGSGLAYVAWIRYDGKRVMIVTGRAGHLGRPKLLDLPRDAQLQALASGLDGPVDALFLRANGHGYPFFCAPISTNGAVGPSFPVPHPNQPNPCHLPYTNGTDGSIPPDRGQPNGYRRTPLVVSRSDGTGRSLAIWDDWPDRGPAYTYGLFYAVSRF